MHEGGLNGHFGVEKTLDMLKEKFYWPHMKRDLQRHYYKCVAYLQAKYSYSWSLHEIGLEVSIKRLDNKEALGYFEQIFFMEGYLVISCFRLNFFINKALLVELRDITSQ